MKVLLNRQLVGVEDLLLGQGTEIQTRGGQQVEITKLDLTTIPWNPVTGQTMAEYIQQEVDVAQQAIIYVNVEAVDGLQANAVYDIPTNTITFTIPRGILSFDKTSGTGAPGTVDTYTFTLSDNATFDIQVYNGADGTGTGDMTKAEYDSNGNGKVDIAEVAESVEWSAIQSKPTILQIDDTLSSSSFVYSSLKTQALHDSQAQVIANLATSQGEFSGTGSPSILVLTTTEQLLPFDVTIPSTNTNMFDFDDANNRVTFKVDASYNFRTLLSLLLETDSTRIVTVTGRNYADNSIVYQRVITVNGTTNDIVPIDSNQLLTVGKNGVPSAPLTIYFTFKVDTTGITLRDLSSLLTSSSAYNLSTDASGISVTPTGNISSTNVQTALAELDTEKAINSTVVHNTGNETIAGVKTFNSNIVMGTGTKIQGDFSGTADTRLGFKSNTLNGNTFITVVPNGTATGSGIEIYNSQDPLNSSRLNLEINSSATDIRSEIRGTGAYLPMRFYTTSMERLRIDTSGNVLVTNPGGLGYGTGSGGTVTQLTSKSTSVMLNKPSGRIVTHNASLAAGATVIFQVNNNLVLTTESIDVIAVDSANYDVKIGWNTTGAFTVKITNITGSPLSEVVNIHFNITKGAIA